MYEGGANCEPTSAGGRANPIRAARSRLRWSWSRWVADVRAELAAVERPKNGSSPARSADIWTAASPVIDCPAERVAGAFWRILFRLEERPHGESGFDG